MIKRYVARRSREAAQVTVTPVSTVQPCVPRYLNPEMPPDLCINLESNEGKMDPELKELEPPSAGTGLETPGEQYPLNEGTWEKGQTIADDYLLVGMGSNQWGDISSPTTEHVDTRAIRTTANTIFPQQGHKPKHEEKGSEENKQFDPGGKGEKAPLWNSVVVFLSFWGESVGPWEARCSCFVFFCLCVSFCSVL